MQDQQPASDDVVRTYVRRRAVKVMIWSILGFGVFAGLNSIITIRYNHQERHLIEWQERPEGAPFDELDSTYKYTGFDKILRKQPNQDEDNNASSDQVD